MKLVTQTNLMMSYDLETSSDGSVVTTTNYLLENLEGMKILPKVAAEVTRKSKEQCHHGDTDHVLSEPVEGEQLNVGLLKDLSGGDTLVARSVSPDHHIVPPSRRTTLPPRPSMRPYPKQGNHVALPDDVVAEAEKKFQSQQRQLENLNKRFEKGKISEKNYLHQARSIML